MRHVPDIPLPPRRHVPGAGTPRPELAMPAPSPLELSGWRDHRGLAFGFDLLDRGYDWEAHEVWESAWQLTPDGPARELLRGLIQLAAARLQHRLGKSDGAARLRERAAGHLRAAATGAGRPIACGVWVDDAIATGAPRWRRRTRDMPGAFTDLLTQPLECAFAIGPGAIIQRTPGYQSYYGGRAYYDDAFDGDVDAARAATEAALAGDGPGYINLVWEVEEPGPVDIELRDGDELDHFIVLAGRALSASPPGPDGVEVRRLSSDADWARATDFAGRMAVIEWGAGARDYTDWRYAHYRRSVELWGGGFFAAFAGAEVVGCLGVVDGGDILRYQDVQVAPSYRRRGIARHLCAWAFERAGAGGGRPAIIVAQAGAVAEGMYRRLGFEHVSTQHYLRWLLTTPDT